MKQLGLVILTMTAAGGALAQADATKFEPQKMQSMPPLSAIPRSGMTGEQVRQECVRLFDNRAYVVLLAEQRPGKHKNDWPFANDVEMKFSVLSQSTDMDGRPVCLVSYESRFNSRNLTTAWSKHSAKFDGKIAYAHLDRGGNGVVMIATGDALAFTKYFYYEDPKTKVPNMALGLHQAWGTLNPVPK